MGFKWKCFREKVPEWMAPMWVVWDLTGEYLFPTGAEALAFMDEEIRSRAASARIRTIMENL